MQSGSHGEEMGRGFAIAPQVNELRCIASQPIREQRGDLGKQIAAVFDGVDLGPIAGRKDDAFPQQSEVAQPRQLAQPFLRTQREALAPVTLGTTARISMVRDPDGNWIELSQRASIVGSLS